MEVRNRSVLPYDATLTEKVSPVLPPPALPEPLPPYETPSTEYDPPKVKLELPLVEAAPTVPLKDAVVAQTIVVLVSVPRAVLKG